jgi:hypothetical protein
VVEGGAVRVAVVCEAHADHRTASLLADRVALASVAWLEPELLEAVRQWCGTTPNAQFLTWKTVHVEAAERKIRAHGHFSGEPAEPDARAARLALLVARSYTPVVSAVLLVRDSDDDPRRVAGLRQARDAIKWPFAVVLGIAHTKRECWLLAAFQPQEDEERGRHDEVRKELGFDPCLRSHELTARHEHDRRSAKRVAGILCPDGGERRLSGTPLDVLKERGRENGLADYLSELETRYVPLFRRAK